MIDLIFDMDDVTSGTNHLFVEGLKQYFIHNPPGNEMLQEIQRHVDLNHQFHTLAFQEYTDLKYPAMADTFRTLIWEQFLKDGTYMLDVSAHISVVVLIQTFLRQQIALGKCRLHILTHRGFHPKAEEYTKRWLDEQGILEDFTNIDVVDYRTVPNKIDYCRQKYGKFCLVDDNPIAGNDVIPLIPELLLYTHGRPALMKYKHQCQVTTMMELHCQLQSVIGTA